MIGRGNINAGAENLYSHYHKENAYQQRDNVSFHLHIGDILSSSVIGGESDLEARK